MLSALQASVKPRGNLICCLWQVLTKCSVNKVYDIMGFNAVCLKKGCLQSPTFSERKKSGCRVTFQTLRSFSLPNHLHNPYMIVCILEILSGSCLSPSCPPYVHFLFPSKWQESGLLAKLTVMCWHCCFPLYYRNRGYTGDITTDAKTRSNVLLMEYRNDQFLFQMTSAREQVILDQISNNHRWFLKENEKMRKGKSVI